MLSFLTSRAGAATVGIVVTLVVAVFITTSIYRAGKDAGAGKLIDRINQENEDAGNSAENWRADYASALTLAACSTSKPAPVTVDGLRPVVGT